jgi:hypothetical protein
MRVIIALVLAAMGIAGAHADPGQAAPDWSSDRFILGTWSCDLVRAGHQPAQERAVYSMGLGGRWLKLTYTKTSHDPDSPSVTTEAYESFDPRLKKWVYVSFGSDGEYGMAYSDGWAGGSKIYGPAADAKEEWRLVETKVSDREFTEFVEVPANDSQWRRVSTLDCRKSN